MVAAVAVVAQAVLGLQRKLAPDRQRASLMVAAAVLVLLVPRVWAQLLALLLGGLVGWCVLTPPELEPSAPERLVVRLRRSVAVVLLGFAVLLFVALPWLSAEARPLVGAAAQWIPAQRCLGVRWWPCGAPFAGASAWCPTVGSICSSFWRGMALPKRCRGRCSVSRPFLALICSQVCRASPDLRWHSLLSFFPSFLLIGGLLPFWSDLGRLAPMRRALLGINASVVGILLAALFQPVWQTGIRGERGVQPGVGGVCAVGVLAATGMAGGAVLCRSGWFDPGLIQSSAESLH